jgi:hypothetical protein
MPTNPKMLELTRLFVPVIRYKELKRLFVPVIRYNSATSDTCEPEMLELTGVSWTSTLRFPDARVNKLIESLNWAGQLVDCLGNFILLLLHLLVLREDGSGDHDPSPPYQLDTTRCIETLITEEFSPRAVCGALANPDAYALINLW